MIDKDREEILNAIQVLNDLGSDLIAGTMVFTSYQSKFVKGEFSQEGIVAVQRMCVSHIILALNKLCEFWDKFHHLVPTKFRGEVKSLVSELKKRDIKEFRNTVVAHIWDKKLERTKTQFEVIDHLNIISAGKPSDFLIWLNNPSDNQYPKSVVSILHAVRDDLIAIHAVSADEVFLR